MKPTDFATDDYLRSRELATMLKMVELLLGDPNLTDVAINAIQEVLTLAYRRLAKKGKENEELGSQASNEVLGLRR